MYATIRGYGVGAYARVCMDAVNYLLPNDVEVVLCVFRALSDVYLSANVRTVV